MSENDGTGPATTIQSEDRDYSFRESVYDATQAAMQPGEINVVIADWNYKEITTQKDFSSIDEAYSFTEKMTNLDRQCFIIGGDIEND